MGTQEKDEEGGANNTAIQTIIDRIRHKEEILRKLKLVQFYRQKVSTFSLTGLIENEDIRRVIKPYVVKLTKIICYITE